jgi:hypothetical protein
MGVSALHGEGQLISRDHEDSLPRPNNQDRILTCIGFLEVSEKGVHNSIDRCTVKCDLHLANFLKAIAFRNTQL